MSNIPKPEDESLIKIDESSKDLSSTNYDSKMLYNDDSKLTININKDNNE